MRPGPEARRGAVWGTLAAAAVCTGIAGFYLRTGFGYAFDFGFALAFAAVLISLTAIVVALLLTIARKLPRMATGWMVGACTVVMLVFFPPQLGVPMAIVAGVVEGFLGAAIATFVTGGFARAAVSKKIVTVCLGLLAVAANVSLVWLLAHQGSIDNIVSWRPRQIQCPPS